MRKLSLLAIILILALAVVGCGGAKTNTGEKPAAEQPKQEKIVLKVGHAMPESHHFQKGLLKFKELVAQKSNGQVEVEIFASGVLGGTRDRVEAVKMGTGDMELVGSPDLARWVDQALIFDMPYLITTYEQADKIMDGEIGQQIKKLSEEKGFKLLEFGENGFRNAFNKFRPINTLKDIEGLKLRVYPSAAYTDTFSALKALPMSTDWGELYTALSQGAVDGAEATEAHFISNKFYEAGQKYFSNTRHMYVPVVFIMNKAKFDGYSPEIQKAIQEAATEAMKFQRQASRDDTTNLVKQMKEFGVEVNDVAELDKFKEATIHIWDKYADKIGKDLLEKAKNM
ncbi:MAG: TRAP transporter substrate-binding protein [Bacillota bacterium]